MGNNDDLKTYRMLYLRATIDSYQWLQEQSPYLWFGFQKNIRALIKIEEYRQDIKRYEEQISQLDIEIRQANRIIAGEEAILGWAGKNPFLASAIENLQKVGLSTVPIVTLFSIAGVGSILNPFANEQQRWGVVFLLWSSVAFVLLTSSGIIKLTYRLSKRHWQQTFWKVRIRTWFVLGCLLFGLIEGISGGSLAAILIDQATAASNARGSSLSMLGDQEKIKITAIVSLFAYLNIFFSIAKGKEVRILQPNRIRRDRAAKVLEDASSEREKLINKIKEIGGNSGKIEKIEKEVEFDISLKKEEAEILNLSNENTLGASFINKHPGTYEKETSISVTNGNGHTKDKADLHS